LAAEDCKKFASNVTMPAAVPAANPENTESAIMSSEAGDIKFCEVVWVKFALTDSVPNNRIL
jgi:hypothetical protein